MAHRELRKTSDLIIEDTGICHANMVRDVVSGLQEVLQQDQTLNENLNIIPEHVDYVANAVKAPRNSRIPNCIRCRQLCK